MLLHQAKAATLKLGTRDQPIHVDPTSNELNNHLGPPQPPERPILSTSLSLPQRPLTTHVQPKARNTSLGKGKTVFPTIVTPRAHNESLVAAPMIPHSPDTMQSLKRKRGDTEAELDLEQTKRSKKSERKRRKRERRAARMAELCNKVASHHSHDTQLNFDLIPGPSELSSSRGRLLPDVLLATAMHPAENPLPESLAETSSRGYQFRQGQDETTSGPVTIGLNEQHPVPCTPHSLTVPPTPTPLVPVQDPLPSHVNIDILDHSVRKNLVPVVNQGAINEVAPKPAHTGSSSLNRKIKERMALLIKHQRLASEADSPPPASLPQTSKPTTTASNRFFDDTIASKQNCLDQAIAENKAALVQLGTSRTKEQKLALIKAVTERNKLITQLTSHIKTQLDALRLNAATPSMSSPPDDPVLKVKWPETELPLYLVITSDDEDSNSAG